MDDLLWPTYDGPGDLAAIEAVPLADRGLPGTTYELLVRAAGLWPDRVALSVLPDGERWEQPAERTYAELLADVHRYANVFHALGVRRTDGGRPAGPELRRARHRDPGRRARRDRRADQQRPVPASTSPSCCAGPAHGSWSPPVPTSPPTSGTTRGTSPSQAGIESAARPTPDRGEARPRRSCSRSTACGSATCPRWRRSSHHDRLRGRAALGHRPRRALPHRRHDRHAEARRAHPRQRGQRRLDDRRQRAAATTDAVVFAALPLFHVNALVVTAAGAAVQGPARRLGGTPGIPRPRAVRELLEAGRALPDQPR